MTEMSVPSFLALLDDRSGYPAPVPVPETDPELEFYDSDYSELELVPRGA